IGAQPVASERGLGRDRDVASLLRIRILVALREQPVNVHRHVAPGDGRVPEAQRLVQPGITFVVRFQSHCEERAEPAAVRLLAAEAGRAEDEAGAVVGGDRAVEGRQQNAVAVHARVVREADVALDARADRSPGAGGVAGSVLPAVRPDDDVLTLVAQVEVEEVLEPHRTRRSLLRRRGAGCRSELHAVEEIERFLASPSLSDATRRAYRIDLEQFADWLRARRLALADVDVRVLSEYAAELGRRRPKLAASSIARKLSSVRSLLRFALGPAHVPDAALAPKRPRRLPSAPKAAEVDDLLDGLAGDGALGLRNRALVELIYSAGLRSAEAVGLDLQ